MAVPSARNPGLESTAKLLRPVGVCLGGAEDGGDDLGGAHGQGAFLHHDRVHLGADAGRLGGAVDAVDEIWKLKSSHDGAKRHSRKI